MSNVGASSFEAQLPAVLAAIARARFVAIDCEFSGLAPRAALRSSPLDCLDARWAKLRASAQAMQLLQFGVCTFEDAPPGAAAGAAPRLVARPFAFHLWPRPLRAAQPCPRPSLPDSASRARRRAPTRRRA